ncbi:MAG: DUF2334 domain-containing protein [Thermoleophilia bacterium]
MRALVVAIHDVSPSTAGAADRLRRLAAARSDGPASLLVVPRAGGSESWRHGPARGWLAGRLAVGDELVLHGHTHRDRRGRDGGELRGRTAAGVRDVVTSGADELAGAVGRPEGFIAPSYAGGPGLGRAVGDAGLVWWASRLRLHWPGGARPLPAIGPGASRPLRRALSPPALRAAVASVAPLPCVRLDLHPADLRHPALLDAAMGALDALLAQDRRVSVHGELIPVAA